MIKQFLFVGTHNQQLWHPLAFSLGILLMSRNEGNNAPTRFNLITSIVKVKTIDGNWVESLDLIFMRSEYSPLMA
jgi:hypothetical protein